MADIQLDSAPDYVVDAARKAHKLFGNTPEDRARLTKDSDLLDVFEGDALSNRDGLTKLLNQKGIVSAFESAAKIIERSGSGTIEPYSIVAYDLIGLKSLNDKLGHSGADEVLKNAANHLKNSVRATDLVARWSGDEFVTILPNSTKDGVERVLNNINSTLPEHVQFHMCYKTFDDTGAVNEKINEVVDQIEAAKKTQPVDATGRLIAGGTIVQLT